MSRRFKMTMRLRHIAEGYGFVSLWIIGFFLFMAIPLGRSLFYSVHHLKISADGLIASYAGASYYRLAFLNDVHFLPLLQKTLVQVLYQVPLILIVSIAIALLLNRKSVGRTLFRGIFFLPVIIASGAILRKLLQQGAEEMPIFSQYHLVTMLSAVIPRRLLEPLLEYADFMTLVMWDSGVQILIFLAGLQTISPALYEAAKCDGATRWESFWKITFPMLVPMMFVNTLYSIVNSFTKTDNEIMNYIMLVVFRSNDYAYGSAIGWIYFVFIFIILGIVFLIFRNRLASLDGRGQ